jgi:ATP-dependent Lhr-like helicase
LGLGEQGERKYGYRNFMDLLSVFTSPPLFLVRHGRREIGFVDSTAFNRRDEPTVLLLAGRAWRVTRVDWARLMADAEPCDQPGRSSWTGQPAALSPTLCRAIRRVLCGNGVHASWSRRAREAIQEARTEHAFLSQEGLVRQKREDATRVWTFAGRRANTAIGLAVELAGGGHCRTDNLYFDSDTELSPDLLRKAGCLLGAQGNVSVSLRSAAPSSLDDIKFANALHPEQLFELYCARMLDLPTGREALSAGSGMCSHAARG